MVLLDKSWFPDGCIAKGSVRVYLGLCVRQSNNQVAGVFLLAAPADKKLVCLVLLFSCHFSFYLCLILLSISSPATLLSLLRLTSPLCLYTSSCFYYMLCFALYFGLLCFIWNRVGTRERRSGQRGDHSTTARTMYTWTRVHTNTGAEESRSNGDYLSISQRLATLLIAAEQVCCLYIYDLLLGMGRLALVAAGGMDRTGGFGWYRLGWISC